MIKHFEYHFTRKKSLTKFLILVLTMQRDATDKISPIKKYKEAQRRELHAQLMRLYQMQMAFLIPAAFLTY